MGDLLEHISEAVMDAMSVTGTDLDDQKIYDIVCKMERQGLETLNIICRNHTGHFGFRDEVIHIKNNQFYEEHGKQYILLPQLLYNKIKSAISTASSLAHMKHISNNYQDTWSLWNPMIDEWKTNLLRIGEYFKKRLMRGPYEAKRMLNQLCYHSVHQPYRPEFVTFFYTDGYGSEVSTTPETDPAAAIMCLVTCSSKIVPDDDRPEFSHPMHASRTIVIIDYINQLCSYYTRKLKELHGVDS